MELNHFAAITLMGSVAFLWFCLIRSVRKICNSIPYRLHDLSKKIYLFLENVISKSDNTIIIIIIFMNFKVFMDKKETYILALSIMR